MIEDGTFREDLFYRLNVMPIFLPSLRDRTDDIGELAQYFMKRFSKSHARHITGITPDALQLLKHYRWPGNIRELENIIERAFIVENGTEVTVGSLPENIRQAQAPAQLSGNLSRAFSPMPPTSVGGSWTAAVSTPAT